MLAVTEGGIRETGLARERTMLNKKGEWRGEWVWPAQAADLLLSWRHWLNLRVNIQTVEVICYVKGTVVYREARISFFLQLNLKNLRYGLCDCRRTCSWGKGMVEERRRRGDMMELGHPVRDIKSPSGELHRGLLSWTAICHWPRRSLTPSARCVLAFVTVCKTVN